MTVYLVSYSISFILARQHFYMLSGLVFNYSSPFGVLQGLRGQQECHSSAGLVLPVFLWEDRGFPALS